MIPSIRRAARPVLAENVVATSQPLANPSRPLSILQQGGQRVDRQYRHCRCADHPSNATGCGLGSDAFCILWDGKQPCTGQRLWPRPPAGLDPEYFKDGITRTWPGTP